MGGAANVRSSIRYDLKSADVELVADDRSDGVCSSEASSSNWENRRASGTIVKAHGLVLSQVSPVLKALLSSEMEEGKTHVVAVPGASASALEALLSVMYEGKSPDPLPCMTGWIEKKGQVGDKAEGNWRGRG